MTRVLAWPAFDRRNPNPYNALLYGALVRRSDADVADFTPRSFVTRRAGIWHIHWPQRSVNRGNVLRRAMRVGAFAGLVVLARLRGDTIVWTIHNLEGHDSAHRTTERLFMRWFVRRVDGVVSLTDDALRLARDAMPPLRRKPAAVIP